MSEGAFERMIRWYPAQWRSRYGGEMAALLEDTYATASDVPIRHRLGLARAGLAERARAAGLIGSAQGPEERVRAGSVLVLCGWALFLVALAIFGKFTDNWLAGTPRSDRWVASSSFDAVTVAAAVGCAIVLLAALCALPMFGSRVRSGDWKVLRRPLLRAVTSAAIAAVLLGGALAWAHHLSHHDRNGGLPVYSALFVVAALAAVVALMFATAAAVSVARRIDLPALVLRALGLMALGLSGLMALIFVGFVTWWASESVHAPGVLSSGIGNGIPFTSSTLPPMLLAAGLLMLGGLVLALGGTVRIARAISPGHATT